VACLYRFGVVALKAEPIKRVSEVAPVVDLLLLDIFAEGGSGQTIDLSLVQEAKSLTGTTPVLIAGGLTPENVKYYIEAVHPFGVDVQTGVEYPDRLGVKDPNRILAFIKAVNS
jgi:phosphoribosylanthranilate isomerase